MTFPWPWAPYIPTLYIISGIAQYLVHNNLSLWLNCQLFVFPWSLPLFRVVFPWSLHLITQVPDGFFWRPRQCVLKHFNKPKFKISSFLVIQFSSDASLPIYKVSKYCQVAVIYFWCFWAFGCVFYADSLSDCVIKAHVVIV